MRERLIELGGSFQFLCTDKGTTIRATIPTAAIEAAPRIAATE
jgi:signal transduction histidine kinase